MSCLRGHLEFSCSQSESADINYILRSSIKLK